jgi:GH25 family lysozyme M1 (1,4-beta-N-acetylmuramidase)
MECTLRNIIYKINKSVNVKKVFKSIITTCAICSFVIFNHSDNASAYSKLLKPSIKITYAKNDTDGIKIKWTSIKKCSGYIIYRKSNENDYWEEIDSTTSRIYIDEDIDTGENYEYAIQAYKYTNKGVMYSKLFNRFRDDSTCNITALPKSVDSVIAKYVSDYKVKLKWKSSGEESGFKIFRSYDGKEWNLIKDIENNEVSKYYDTTIDNSGLIMYKVIPYEIIDGVIYEGTNNVKVACACSDSGIDVSYHNGVIDWKKVKNAGIDFAFIRIGYGDYRKKKGAVLDNKFARNIRLARKNGIKIGVYFYGNATNISQARKEANFVVNKLKNYGGIDFPVAYDYENSYRKHFRYKKSNTKIIDEFCKIIKKSGYEPLIYSDNNMLTDYVQTKKLEKYGFWVAYWTYDSNDYPVELNNVKIWQYSDRGRIKGIKTYTDKNVTFIK